MKFKEFNDWCNQRACDGCWSMNTAIYCIKVIDDIRSKPFWKREKYWKETYKKFIVDKIIEPINEKMREMGII